MSWINKIKPVVLYQSSDLPFVILDNGVKLCYDNFYSIKPEHSEFNLSFKAHKNKLFRQSTNYYKFKNFPVTIPFEDVIQLDKSIIKGHLLKHAKAILREPITISLIKSNYLENMDDENLSVFADQLDEYSKNFLLVGDDLSSQIHLLEDISHIIHHADYYRTAVTMAHYICPSKYRKFCWTQYIPDLTVNCFGLENSEEKDQIGEALEYIGITNFDVTWED